MRSSVLVLFLMQDLGFGLKALIRLLERDCFLWRVHHRHFDSMSVYSLFCKFVW